MDKLAQKKIIMQIGMDVRNSLCDLKFVQVWLNLTCVKRYWKFYRPELIFISLFP